jgi:hypothetical protein
MPWPEEMARAHHSRRIAPLHAHDGDMRREMDNGVFFKESKQCLDLGKRQPTDSDAQITDAATAMIGCIELACMKIRDHGSLAAMAAAARQDPAEKIAAGEYSSFSSNCRAFWFPASGNRRESRGSDGNT